MPTRVLSSVLLALLAWIPLGRGQALASRGDLRDRALFAVSALDLATSPARAASATSVRADLAPSRRPATPPVSVPVVDAEHVWAHVRRTWWPAAADRPANWRGFRAPRLAAPHDATAPPRHAQTASA